MSYHQLVYHIVFSTRDRAQSITAAYDHLLYTYMAGCIKGISAAVRPHLYAINGMPDHIHILVSLPPTIAISDFIRDLKRSSSIWIKGHRDLFPHFPGWQKSYGVFTCSEWDTAGLIKYIKNQKIHHRGITFEQEYRKILETHHVPYDETYFLKE